MWLSSFSEQVHWASSLLCSLSHIGAAWNNEVWIRCVSDAGVWDSFSHLDLKHGLSGC